MADREGWEVYASEKHYKGILATALASEHQQAKNAAVNLVQYFITKGHFSYRSLLG